MGVNEVATRFPWEVVPQPVEETLAALQRDIAYMVQYTAVLVRSSRAELRMLVNTERGQIVPRGECKFADGTTIEFQDLGMPQVNAPSATVDELVMRVLEVAKGLGLELAT